MNAPQTSVGAVAEAKPRRQLLVFTLAAFVLVPVGVIADDLSCRLSRGGFASIGVDSDAGTVSYSILADNVGNLSSAEITSGGSTFLDLGISGSFGSASGDVDGSGVDLADLEANTGSYGLSISGTGGSSSCTLETAGESSSGDGGAGTDLRMLKVNGKTNGRLTAKVRNLGPERSLPTTVRFYASDDRNLSNDDVLLGTGTLKAIGVNRKKKVKPKVTYPASLAGQSVFIIGVADEDNINADPNFNNNSDSSNGQVEIPE